MTANIAKALGCLSFIALIGASDATQLLSGFPPPRTIQTQNATLDAVIFWDATPYVEKFITLDTPPADALGAMEYQAIKIFVTHAPALARTAHHLRLIVFFTKTGAISARYQTATIQGVQTVLTLDGALHKHMKFPKDWERAAEHGISPAGIKMQIVSDALKN